MALLSTDPVGRLLDADGDIDISTGRTRFASGLTAFAQGANARIRLVKGEWFLNRAVGVAYAQNAYVTAAQALLGAAFDEAKARREFTTAISGTPGFGSMVSMVIAFGKATRKLTVTWTARTSFGDVTSTVEV